MPFSGFEDFQDCTEKIMERQGVDKDDAQRICGMLQARAEANMKAMDYRENAVDLRLNIIEDNDHFVRFPVVLTTEGVMNGGLKARAELSKSFWTFDGVPVTNNHPFGPATLGDAIGRVDPGVKYDEKTGDVSGTITIVKSESTEYIIKNITDGNSDVSIGFFCDVEASEGTFDNPRTGDTQEYDIIERNILGDHLAVNLKVGEGACSQEMGCGIPATGVDEKKEMINMVEENETKNSSSVDIDAIVANAIEKVSASYEEKMKSLIVKLNNVGREPLVEKLVELTGKDSAEFEACDVPSLHRQIEIAEASITTRKGQDAKQASNENTPGPDPIIGYKYVSDEKGCRFVETEIEPFSGKRVW